MSICWPATLESRYPRVPGEAGGKLKSFIIHLRNNPGGLLDQAISVSDAFLEKGEIVSTRLRTARRPNDSMRARATSSRTGRSSC
jgi:carboxyl-terminal processing protease